MNERSNLVKALHLVGQVLLVSAPCYYYRQELIEGLKEVNNIAKKVFKDMRSDSYRWEYSYRPQTFYRPPRPTFKPIPMPKFDPPRPILPPPPLPPPPQTGAMS